MDQLCAPVALDPGEEASARAGFVALAEHLAARAHRKESAGVASTDRSHVVYVASVVGVDLPPPHLRDAVHRYVRTRHSVQVVCISANFPRARLSCAISSHFGLPMAEVLARLIANDLTSASAASGLYYIAEIVEEYPKPAKSFVTYSIWVCRTCAISLAFSPA